jgi:hypothetical protein
MGTCEGVVITKMRRESAENQLGVGPLRTRPREARAARGGYAEIVGAPRISMCKVNRQY